MLFFPILWWFASLLRLYIELFALDVQNKHTKVSMTKHHVFLKTK